MTFYRPTVYRTLRLASIFHRSYRLRTMLYDNRRALYVTAHHFVHSPAWKRSIICTTRRCWALPTILSIHLLGLNMYVFSTHVWPGLQTFTKPGQFCSNHVVVQLKALEIFLSSIFYIASAIKMPPFIYF